MWRKLLIVIAVLMLVAGGGLLWYLNNAIKQGALQKVVLQEVAQRFLPPNAAAQGLPQKLFGFETPKTYLILFLNNTELRPGGGFIGAYAVVRFNQGKPELLAVEGSESLDAKAVPAELGPAPMPITKYLKVSRWYFRDSNWSPDFVSSSVRALTIFQQEHGMSADNIDGVVGFTPTAVEELLKITGPITVDNQTYNATNFTATLEYEVEHGYAERGIDFSMRKAILGKLGMAFVAAVERNLILNFSAYFNLAERMMDQKQVMGYLLDTEAEQIITSRGWSGAMKETNGDYLLWADANLGALKTDHAIDRSLTYAIMPSASGTFTAKATMHYVHTGQFDWRTSRYRNYARVFVPVGSKLRRVVLPGSPSTTVESGIENGRTWFGTFLSIEPGATQTLTFEYELAPQVVVILKANSYQLLVQKQIGTIAVPLTLRLDFGKAQVNSTPLFEQVGATGTLYSLTTDLRTDRTVSITTRP